MRLWIDDVKPTPRDIFGANVRENRGSVVLDTYNNPTDEECESISEESTTILPTPPVEANEEPMFIYLCNTDKWPEESKEYCSPFMHLYISNKNNKEN